MPNQFNKYAAKEKVTRKKVVSALEKAKKTYGQLKASLDSLESQAEKINSALEKTKSNCSAARKEMMKYHKTIQNMDLSNASDVIFYESSDVGYLINGTECHLDMDDVGDLRIVPMREHRKSKRQKHDTNEVSYVNESDDSSDEDGSDTSDHETKDMDELNLTHDELDNLYASLLRTASDIELDKLSAWAESASEDEIVDKIESLLEESQLVSDTSKIEAKIQILESFLENEESDDLFAFDGDEEDLGEDELKELLGEDDEDEGGDEGEDEEDDEEEDAKLSFKKRMKSLDRDLDEELLEGGDNYSGEEDFDSYDEDEEDDSFEDEEDSDLEELDFEMPRRKRSILDNMEDEET